MAIFILLLILDIALWCAFVFLVKFLASFRIKYGKRFTNHLELVVCELFLEILTVIVLGVALLVCIGLWINI